MLLNSVPLVNSVVLGAALSLNQASSICLLTLKLVLTCCRSSSSPATFFHLDLELLAPILIDRDDKDQTVVHVRLQPEVQTQSDCHQEEHHYDQVVGHAEQKALDQRRHPLLSLSEKAHENRANQCEIRKAHNYQHFFGTKVFVCLNPYFVTKKATCTARTNARARRHSWRYMRTGLRHTEYSEKTLHTVGKGHSS